MAREAVPHQAYRIGGKFGEGLKQRVDLAARGAFRAVELVYEFRQLTGHRPDLGTWCEICVIWIAMIVARWNQLTRLSCAPATNGYRRSGAVQDADYLRRVAHALVSPEKARPLLELLRPVGPRDLHDLMGELLAGPRSTVGLRQVRDATVNQARWLEPLTRTTVARAWTLRTVDGQTLHVTKVSRSRPRQPEPKRGRSGATRIVNRGGR